MKKRNPNIYIEVVLPICLLAAIVLGYIIFSIYLRVTYGNLPPDQVPSWVHWWMMGKQVKGGTIWI